jgi:serine/threonine protein kinase
MSVLHSDEIAPIPSLWVPSLSKAWEIEIHPTRNPAKLPRPLHLHHTQYTEPAAAASDFQLVSLSNRATRRIRTVISATYVRTTGRKERATSTSQDNMRYNTYDLLGCPLKGRYLLEKIISSGGMGTVYSAADLLLKRSVAVKVVKLASRGSDSRARVRERFRSEAQTVAALPGHPNLVPVYDYGTDETLDLDFLVMEEVRGEDLANRLARTKHLPLVRSLQIAVQVARGLSVGHKQGLVHGDVKPGNVLLERPAENRQKERARVIDFGIPSSANAGAMLHTPEYASPEQLARADRISASSDVFSLGVMLHEMVFGHRPSRVRDRALPFQQEIVGKASHGKLRRGLAGVLKRALAIDPEARYPDATTFARELLHLRQAQQNARVIAR